MSNKFERFMSLISRAALGKALGEQYSGNRDLYEVFGWNKAPTYIDFYKKYLRQGIARRIITAPVSATWRNPPEVISGNTEWDTAWNHMVKTKKLWGTIDRADRLAGIGQYSVILVGLSDSSKLEMPVNPNKTPELLYLQPYSEPYAKISEYETDPTNSRYGLPKMYELSTVDPSMAAVMQSTGQMSIQENNPKTFKVHHSRIVHIAENLIDSNFLGTPRLLHVYNTLDDLLKVAGGTSETYWMTGNRGMQVDIDKDAEFSTEDAAALSDEIDEYMHQLRRVIKTRGVKIENLGGTTPDPKNTFDMLISELSGGTGIPKRILTGSEVGQLASDQDRANWADLIKERRTSYAEPRVLLPLIETLANSRVLPAVNVADIVFDWPDNFQLTPLESAQTMAQRGRAIVNIAKHYKEMPMITVGEARHMLGLKEELPEGIEEHDTTTTSTPENTNPVNKLDMSEEEIEEQQEDENVL